ncbi:hypothetical protein KC19_2G150400 [Ceratodon purpureus]|uniref:Uncharacterized protein n=1 Tax=Ceratodon purpureus TaxID=3225 RepID=A0A8T0IVT3_CERPU|nr:hypothetical protein KC19_2G150400 [Ceratodon purpureus]
MKVNHFFKSKDVPLECPQKLKKNLGSTTAFVKSLPYPCDSWGCTEAYHGVKEFLMLISISETLSNQQELYLASRSCLDETVQSTSNTNPSWSPTSCSKLAPATTHEQIASGC